MMEKWTPLTEKYGCSPANLVIRYTASAINNLNILCAPGNRNRFLIMPKPWNCSYRRMIFAG